MSFSTVTNSTVVVTPEATVSFANLAEGRTRLSMEQAQVLVQLVHTFQPTWDRGAVLRQMQITALYSELDAPGVITAFINAAASGKPFEEISFPGTDPLRNRDN